MTIGEELISIQKKWHGQNTCALKTQATQPVFGHGNPDSDIVFVGEAPGKKEDATGIPFVGASGKFLDEMLSSIKLKRDDVYITNIVKYRPPDNRDPLPEEKEACRGWLMAELSFIKPKLIIFIGRHAMNNFFPLEKISDVHGTLLTKTIPELGRQSFFALYHPAAALYNGGMRTTLLGDFAKIPLVLTNHTPKD